MSCTTNVYILRLYIKITQDGKTALDYAKGKGRTGIFKLIESCFMLIEAARKGDMAEVERLLRSGANINQRDEVTDCNINLRHTI